MSDNQLSYNCRVELTKPNMKTSTQIGLAYKPPKIVMYEKLEPPRIPPVKRSRPYITAEGYKSLYGKSTSLKSSVTKNFFMAMSVFQMSHIQEEPQRKKLTQLYLSFLICTLNIIHLGG